jgi:signal transduction histidine kinase
VRARITLAVVAILALALAIAGVVSALLIRSAARSSAQQTVLAQTRALVASVQSQGKLHQLIDAGQASSSGELLGELLALVQSITSASTSELVITSGGGLLSPAPGSPVSAAQLPTLVHCGTSVSGLSGDTAYAAAPLLCNLASLSSTGASSPETIASVAIVLTEPVTYSTDSVWYFVLAAAVALVVAGTVAALIARRIAHHVVAAAGAAEAIAAGDLDVRLPDAGGAYPELVALGSAINTMAAGLARARALERQFLLSVSHDLRTPLTSIRGWTEAISDGAVPDPRAAAEVVMAEAARLERLIRDLLDLAYLDARQFSLHPARLDLGAAVAAAAEALRYELENANVALEVRQPDEPLVVHADGDRLAQIVANLIENAGKYARSRVVVAVAPGLGLRPPAGSARATRGMPPGPGPSVAVVVEDDGPGIALEDLPHVFERLYTSERRPSRAARGTGLGLAIVAELAVAMGGRVSAESPTGPDGGTRMTVTLPLRTPRVPAGSAGGGLTGA